jgi:hypothetical protein
MIDPVYISMVERLDPKMPNAPDEIVVACMLMGLRRQMGDQPQAIYDCLGRELTTALRVVRERTRCAPFRADTIH